MLKKDPASLRLWETEQMIDFGLDKKKLEKKYLKAHLDELIIDPEKKPIYLFFYGEISPHQNSGKN